MTSYILEVQNLRTYFHNRQGVGRAVDGVDLSIAAGRTLCIVGETGSGKSVTALSILGLIAPPGRIEDGSEVGFAGVNLVKASPKYLRRVRGAQIGMIFQEPMSSLDPLFTVGSQVAEAVRAHSKVPRRAAMVKAIELLERVGIPSPERVTNSYPHELSGGMRQRVMIACALSCHPRLLIADEPTTALDVTIQAQILKLIRGLRDEIGMSVLLITHDMGVVREMADDIAVMYAGQVVEVGSSADVLRDPQHPYTRALLRSAPAMGMNRTGALETIPGAVPSAAAWPSGCRFAPRCASRFEQCENAPPLLSAERRQSRCWLSSPDKHATSSAVLDGRGIND